MEPLDLTFEAVMTNGSLDTRPGSSNEQSILISLGKVIKGDKGERGEKGDPGQKGERGADGRPGSDASVTKANVEAVLTGEITSHTHPHDSTKQDTISDLESIRTGAGKGNTSVQPADITDFVTKSVNDLLNYYLKSETYTRNEVNTLIASVKQFTYEIVSSLPAASAQTMSKIYLVPRSSALSQNVKDEYITLDNGTEAETRYTWEKIGDTAIDLSNYVTNNALATALAAYTTTANLTILLAGKQDTISDLATIRTGAELGATSVQPAAIANFITRSVNDLLNYYLKTDTYTKTEVNNIVAAIKQFTYEIVAALPSASASTMNKIYLVPSASSAQQNVKDEYITIDNGAEAQTRYTWEQIGSTSIDLSNYYTKSQVDSALGQKEDSLEWLTDAEINAMFD